VVEARVSVARSGVEVALVVEQKRKLAVGGAIQSKSAGSGLAIKRSITCMDFAIAADGARAERLNSHSVVAAEGAACHGVSPCCSVRQRGVAVLHQATNGKRNNDGRGRDCDAWHLQRDAWSCNGRNARRSHAGSWIALLNGAVAAQIDGALREAEESVVARVQSAGRGVSPAQTVPDKGNAHRRGTIQRQSLKPLAHLHINERLTFTRQGEALVVRVAGPLSSIGALGGGAVEHPERAVEAEQSAAGERILESLPVSDERKLIVVLHHTVIRAGFCRLLHTNASRTAEILFASGLAND